MADQNTPPRVTTAYTAMPTLYKVIQDGASCRGGNPSFQWPLPTQQADGSWEPGGWVEVDLPLRMCANGLHLTTDPVRWYADGTQVYYAAYDGGCLADGNQRCVQRARLLAPVDWSQLGLYLDGAHLVSRGSVRAFGSATVEATGAAVVSAGQHATVRAYGWATVVAYDDAMVQACEHATVISTEYHHDSAVVRLAQRATHIDRRNGKLVLRTANAELEAAGG